MPSPPRAAVFDCDGLLVDTRACWSEAYLAAAAEAGASLSADGLERLSGALDGASVELAAAELSRALGAEIPAAAIHRALREEVEAQPHEPLPGARALLASLERRLPLAVASNGPADVVDAILRRAGLRHFFGQVVTAEEVAAPKPDPAVYLEACRRLAVEPGAAVAFEDSALGAASARAAGLFVVGVPSGPDPFDADRTAAGLSDPELLECLTASARTVGAARRAR